MASETLRSVFIAATMLLGSSVFVAAQQRPTSDPEDRASAEVRKFERVL